MHAIQVDDVKRAAERIAGHVHRTPVLTCSTFDRAASTADHSRSLFYKCENMQRTGAFKMRGAMNAVLSLPAEVRARGVVTHSSGNHAQALALAAKLAGIPAHIVMPENAPANKRAAVLGYGARVIPCAPTLKAREDTAAAVAQDTAAVFISPYNDPAVMAGQGTVALELLADVPDLHALVVPVGGGGLISGIAVAAKALRPDIVVIGAEPTLAADAARSKETGSRQPPMPPLTIADGLRTSLGTNTWPIVRDLVDVILTVDEAEIVAHTRAVFERMKLVIEPSAGVPVAVAQSAALTAHLPARVRAEARVGVVLCGGNVDVDRLPWLIGTA